MDVRLNDDQSAVDYLLGELSETDQLRLEERFFQDAQLSDLLSEAEDDLVDRYARHELSARQRRLFESRFLVTERRREKLRFARTLLEAERQRSLERVPASQTPVDWWYRLRTLFIPSRPLLSYGLAALALVMLIGGWLAVSEFSRLRTKTAEINVARIESERQNEQLRREAEDQRRRNDELAATNQQLERQQVEIENRNAEANREVRNERSSLKSYLTFVLSPGYRSGEGPKRLILSNAIETIRLQLRLNPGDDYSSYQVRLQTAGGEAVRSWQNLQATAATGDRVLLVSIPAALLKSGQYELTLSGASSSGAVEDLGYYYFNVQK